MSFESDIAEIPQIARGLCWCTLCGRKESFRGTSPMNIGWPTCCRGHTMTIDSPAERGLSRYPENHPDNAPTAEGGVS